MIVQTVDPAVACRGVTFMAAIFASLALLLGCPARPDPERFAGRRASPENQESVEVPPPVERRTAADFLPPVITDEFNPDVAPEDRVMRRGTPGGSLRIRNPANLAHLNAITVSGQPERVVILHMTDDLLGQDPTTLEPFPELAHWFQEGDLIKRRDGAVQEGRIVHRDENEIHFVPGAWRATYSRFDVLNPAAGSMTLELSEAVGGGVRRGLVKVQEHTVMVDEGLVEGALIERIPLLDLDIYTVEIGTLREERPWAKPNCAFEFILREGIRWHDGQPFTASDVIFSVETILNPNVDSLSLRPSFLDIERFEQSRGGRGVRFDYKRPHFRALNVLGGMGAGWILPRHIFRPERFGGDARAFADAFNSHPFKDAPVYTGPYRFLSWNRGTALVLQRNADYWKNGLPDGAIPRWFVGQPWLDRLEWHLYQDSAASIKDLQNGRLDADLDVDPTMWAQPETNSPGFLALMTRARTVGFLYTYIGWNLENPIFRDPATRRALAHFIPRDDIGQYVHKNAAFPVTGPFYSLGPAHDPTVQPIPFDPEEGMRLLARAGWLDRDGDGVREKWIDGRWMPLRFNYFIHNARDYHQKIADIIKEHVEEAGVEMSIVKLDWSIFADAVRDKRFDAVRFAWGQDVEPDPFQIWHSSQIANKGDNFISYRNERVDEIAVKIREEFDPIARWNLAREMHRIVAEEQPAAFLFGFHTDFFIHRNLRGVRLYPSAYPHNFAEWWWATPPNRGGSTP